jgi:hypothetical protein
VPPESIELYERKAETQGTEEASPEQVNPEIKGGGRQRITRKHKNSIIGSARKTRTYR